MAQTGTAQKRARTKLVRRWRNNMEVQDDPKYVEMLNTLSEGSVRRNFNPYTDIDWKSPEFAVTDNDPRWILPKTDPLGRHSWYQSQSHERQIEIGMWRQANVAKVGLHFESILIRGLMEYAFWVPNGSPEYRYCLHEAVEECNHTMMFQEMVNHIGRDVPGMPRLLKWIQPYIPLAAGPLRILLWFGILAGEEPIDHTQKNVLREGKELPPIMERVMAIHVAEEARHISFAHEYLRKRVPDLPRRKRFWLSLYVPLTMRILCSAIVVPPKAFWQEFDMLYIDPVACVDCGACVSACPVGAIAPDAQLTSEQLPFIALNAAFYPDRPAGEKLPPTSKRAPGIPRPEVRATH